MYKNKMPYAKDTDLREIYDPSIGYEMSHGVVVYAKDKFGNEYYFTDPSLLKEVYKTNRDGSFTYAKNNNMKEIYAKNQNNDEYYYRDNSNLNNQYDVYAKNRFGIYSYARDKNNNELYATDKDWHEIYITVHNKHIYARDMNHNEKYAKRFSKDEYYITAPINLGEFYAKDKLGNEIYAKDREKNQFYYADPKTRVTSYAKKQQKQEYYAKDKTGSEIYMKKPASSKNRYILNAAGDQVYAKDYLGNQIYLLDSRNTVVYAHKANGCEIYAKDAKGNEFYKGYRYAKNEKVEFYYAQDNLQREMYMRHPVTNKEICIDGKYTKHYKLFAEEFYPKEENGIEYYVTEGLFAKRVGGKEKYPNISPTNHTKYARDSLGNEIYPVWNGKQHIVGNRYAIQNKNQIYPSDIYNNQYYHQNKFAQMSDGTKYYAIRSDNSVIIPLNPTTKELMLLSSGPKVELAQIRAKYTDYATTTVKITPNQLTKYFIPTKTLSISMIIAIIEFLIILILLFFYFFT